MNRLATQPTSFSTIEAVLDEFRTRLRLDGTDVNVVSVEAGVLRLRMTGRPSSCPMALALLQSCLESAVRERIPGVSKVQLER